MSAGSEIQPLGPTTSRIPASTSAGVVLAGFTLFGQWDRAYKAWHAVHFPGANPTKRSWLTRSVSWVEPHTGSLVGCSLLAFVVGAIVGLFSLMLHA